MKYSWMILFLCLFGCDVEFQKEADRQKELTTVRSTYYLTTVVHDEHLFILSKSYYFIHHPNCPCCTKRPDKPEQLSPSPPIIEGLPSILIR